MNNEGQNHFIVTTTHGPQGLRWSGVADTELTAAARAIGEAIYNGTRFEVEKYVTVAEMDDNAEVRCVTTIKTGDVLQYACQQRWIA